MKNNENAIKFLQDLKREDQIEQLLMSLDLHAWRSLPPIASDIRAKYPEKGPVNRDASRPVSYV